ncbi:MAG: biopolymer transporter ExbD [Alphaproteobacteria bacterium]|nr:biopolymer transporter ExbD [Alphaproteobacteria bacterium]
MRRARPSAPPRLDLLPVMNLVTLLIPFLLASAQFVELAVVDTTLPALVVDPVHDDERLDLTVLVHDGGYRLTTRDGFGGPEPRHVDLPCLAPTCPGAGAYDTTALTAQLAEIKDRHPAHRVVNVIATDDVPYDVLLATLDATREDPADRDTHGRARPLFPHPVIAAVVN